jgi:beta-glucuronidase
MATWCSNVRLTCVFYFLKHRFFLKPNFLIARTISLCCLLILASSVTGKELTQAERNLQARVAMQELANYAAHTAIGSDGRARGDYDLLSNEYQAYESTWHTGQLIFGLVEADRISGDAKYLAAAKRAGDWWISQEIKTGPLTGMLNAMHGDKLGHLINFSTLSDGAPGLFALSQATGDRRYADTAIRAGEWSLKNLYLEKEALIYNIIDPSTGEIWRTRSPHSQHANPATLTQVARPNTEGFLFADMYGVTKNPAHRDAFLNLANGLVRRQHANGFWMEFEPNDPKRGFIHPRFNIWYAESLLEAYKLKNDKRYLDAARRTARAMQTLMQADGSIYYDNFLDGRIDKSSPTGSATAFAGLLWLALRSHGDREFDADINKALHFVSQQRYSQNHANPNLRGALLDLRQRRIEQKTSLLHRPMASGFGLRFLARYLDQFDKSATDASNTGSTTGNPPKVTTHLPMSHIGVRKTRKLDGDWQYIVDPYQIAINKPRPPRRSLHLDQTADALNHPLIEYEWDTSPSIKVPGDWNTQKPELFYYEGLLWYRKKFDAELGNEQRQFLYFEAANYRSRVWLNGESLGQHDGGFTPFEFEVSGKLKARGNSIVVAIDSTRQKSGIPSVDFDWFNYGGLTRSVHLVTMENTFIRHSRFWLNEKNQLQVSAVIDGMKAAGNEMEIKVPELGINAVIKADQHGRANAVFPINNFTAWSPEQPKLYAMTAKAGNDTVTENIGLRRIEARDGKIYLNGKAIFLRGIALHEERLGKHGGRVRNADEARQLLLAAKRMHSNFVRLAHYPHSEAALRQADELGLLVWSELPVYWDEIEYSNPETLQLAQTMQAVMIERDFNRASYVLHSVANETSIKPERNAFLRQLISDARQQDGSRLITAALNKTDNKGSDIRIEDPLGEDLDVLSLNQYEGWYGSRKITEIAGLNFSSRYNKPFLFSEFGADAPLEYSAKPDVRWSIEYQDALFSANIDLMEKMPDIDGLSPWVLKDFRAPRRWHGRFQKNWNRKGLIDPEGRAKPAYKTLQKWYKKKQEST